ncbi:MAG: uridine kinase, partial [Anaerolineales bacterium]
GKTTVARAILERIGAARIAYLPHDAYYRDFTDFPHERRDAINWDHPDALDTELMIAHIQQLKHQQAVSLPVYDFAAYRRTDQTTLVVPQPVILVEGILIFADPQLRKLFDVKIFVDTDADLRLIRRLQRDLTERGRTLESVVQQYLSTVRPMHLEFVEPSKRFADIILPEGGQNEVALDLIVSRLESMFKLGS